MPQVCWSKGYEFKRKINEFFHFFPRNILIVDDKVLVNRLNNGTPRLTLPRNV
jgi:hypothetical protein